MTDRNNYNKIYENGLNHINSAKILAQNFSYGFAISHLILGMEELIKYQVYMTYLANNYMFNNEVNSPKTYESIFKSHGLKHDLIKEFQKAISDGIADTLVESQFYEMTGRPLKPEHIEVNNNRFKQWGAFLSVAYKEINIPEVDRPSFFNWLDKANDLKNQGFYVGVNNGICESPKEILEEKYKESLKYVEAILAQTEVIKSLDITDEELIDFLNQEV